MTENSFLSSILDLMYEGIYFVDTERTITFWNKASEKITGFSANDVIGKHCYDNILSHVDGEGNKLCLSGCPLHSTIKDGVVREADLYLYHKAGHRVAVSVKTIPMYEDNKIIGSVEIFKVADQTFTSELEKYKALAMKDQLTSLPNRRYVDTYFELKMKEQSNFNMNFGIAFIDIDHFKYVNDTYGHDIGDEVLKMVSKTLISAVRGNDLIARWGGEEFIAVFTNSSEEILRKLTERIRVLVENSYLKVNNTELKVTVSLGATMFHLSDEKQSVIKRADDAMYQSKNNGRNIVTII